MTIDLPVERGPVDTKVFYTSKAPRFLPQATTPPSLKTYLQGRRPPRYFLAWPYGFEDLGRRGVQGVQNIIDKAAIEWYAETQQDPSRPPGPDEFFINYKHDEEPCLFFVRITDNADEKRLAFAQDEEYLAKMRKLLPEFAEEELIWIRV